MEYLVIGVLGLVVGLLTTKVFLLISMRKSIGLYILSGVLGILGAASAEQLVHWGPSLFHVEVAPVIVGGIVLPMVGIYFYYLIKNFIVKLRTE
ncbi:hypothetical protein [Apilactobacillus kunkeei]|uniref:hypothetical protein n=1 Tax=Apilactobacillus kunkeei TaxID=148814 RepID=UPI0006B2547B|nr:hypothetical protein [Apilactobacillus kunkeei]